MNTLDIQRALKLQGFDPGPIDGIPGRQTTAAVKKFQAAKHLLVDGIVGPKTIIVLFPARPLVPEPPVLPWMDAATSLMGLKEGAGAKDNPAILNWADDLDLHYPHDDIPWCGLFVAHCVGSTLADEVLPANPLGARNWLQAGVSVKPQHGAILVFWREKRTGFKGHVGFYQAERGDAFKVRGGNQSDSVSDAWVAKDRLLGARWPKSVPFLETRAIVTAGDGKLSTNEA